MIKKALGFQADNQVASGGVKLLKNNFSLDPNSEFSDNNKFSSSPLKMSIIDMLTLGNRYSDTFIDFLCQCLKFDPSARISAQDLLEHEFFSDNHICKGPLLSLDEILKMNSGLSAASSFKSNVESLGTDHLERFLEALEVVFFNKNTRKKFENMFFNGKSEDFEKKVLELASEFDITTHKLREKINNFVANKLK